MKHWFFSLLLITLFSFALNAQTFTVSGTLTDALTGEDLIGATISVVEDVSVGTASNTYGFYSISLAPGTYTLAYQYIGYETTYLKVELADNIKQDVELGTGALELNEVVIKAEAKDENISNTKMSVTKLDPKAIESVPVLFGEKDIIKTMQLTPGVKSAGEGNSGFYVRGGGLDQNLILLDEAPVYNASHLLGFFSVFNSDALKDVTLYKGGIPAEFGGRASSVMDIKMKDGNKKRYSVSGGLGLISSKLTFEGPVVKNKGSFIVSGRRTYADQFLRFSSNEDLTSSTLYFYDLNMKANYAITEKDRLFISGYFGRDIFGFNDNQFGFEWGNQTGTVRWNHLFSDKLFLNTSLIYSKYNYKFNVSFAENASFSVASAIQDWNLKQDFSYFLNPKNTVKIGWNGILHTFLPGSIETGEDNIFNADEIPEQKALEFGFYAQNDQKINDALSLNYGLRYSIFNQVGPGTIKTFNTDGEVTAINEFDDWESVQFYHGLEPRVSAKYQINGSTSLKTSLTRNYQYLHLLSNTTTTTPTDVYVPSSINVKPQIADQVALGLFKNLSDNKYETYVEGYYKQLYNQIDYKNGADLVLNADVEGELVFGSGYAYGAEFFIKKKEGRLTGWISYTLGRTLRTFDAINNGDPYPARQDRIHDLAVVALYDISSKWKLATNFVFYTGDAATFPSGRYSIGGIDVPLYTERNGYRFPNYHRADIGVTYTRLKTDTKESTWNFSVYNFYGKENAFTIDFQENPDNPEETQAVQLALFKIIPSVSYNFKF